MMNRDRDTDGQCDASRRKDIGEKHGVVVMKLGKGTNRDPKIRLLRWADSEASGRFGIGSRPKKVFRPKPSLPKLKCLDDADNQSGAV